MYIVGVDLGGTNIKASLVDEKGTLIKKSNIKTNVNDGRENVCLRMAQMIKELTQDEKEVLIGIGSPGSIDRENGIVKFSPNLRDWNDFPLAHTLQKLTNYKTFVENDAKAAALGEKWFGVAKGYKDFIVLTLGTGVGGGAYTNGQLLIGGGGIGGELGHMIVDPKGRLCGCGNHGCLETYSSNTGMRAMAMDYKRRYPDSKIFDYASDGQYGAFEIFQAYQQGDRLAQLIVREFSWGLGVGIGSLVNIFNPDLVILTGGISRAYNLFIDEVRQYAKEYTILSIMDTYDIIQSNLKEDGATLGAASVALERIGGNFI